MCQDNFIKQIHYEYQYLTKAERKVADFVLEDSERVLFMSITDLAAACKVGETTVFRFCKSMKLQGYQEFRIKLSLSIKSQEDNIETETLNGNIGIDDSFPVVTQKLLNSNVNALMETNSLVNEENVSQIIDKMIAAKKIMLFGVGASQLMAMTFTTKFLRICNKIFCFTDSHIQTMAASTLQADDVAIVISYSGSTKDSILFAKLAKEAGAFVVGITKYKKSPLTNYVDLVLLCGASEGPLQGGSTTAVMSELYLMDVIYVEYYLKTYDLSYENNQKTSESIIDKMY